MLVPPHSTSDARPGRRALRSRPLPHTLEVRIAGLRYEFSQAYGLVYEAYRSKGYVEASPHRILYRLSYGLPNTRTFVALQASQIVGTLTVVGDSPLGLPLEALYHDEVQRLRGEAPRLAEIGSLAIHSAYRQNSLDIFVAMTRFMIQYACNRRYDSVVIAVHPRQTRFYQSCFGFRPFGPRRKYLFVRGQPAIPCSLDLNRLVQTVPPAVYREYFSQPIPGERFAAPPMNRADHEYFCRCVGILPEIAARGPVQQHRYREAI